MLVQYWAIDVADSRWLLKARLSCLLLLAVFAGWIFAFVSGVVGVSGWWGDWLWPWPILLYLTWSLAMQPAPLFPSVQSVTLIATGELDGSRICHSLRTPWLIALYLRQQPLTSGPGLQEAMPRPRWVWIMRDQLSADNWVRLNRVCQSSSYRPDKLS